MQETLDNKLLNTKVTANSCSESPEQRFKRKKVEATQWSEDDIRHGIASAEEVRDIRSNTAKQHKLPDWQLTVNHQWGRLLYSYFNWRQVSTICPIRPTFAILETLSTFCFNSFPYSGNKL